MATAPDIDRAVKILLATARAMRLCDEATLEVFGISAAQLAIIAELQRRGKPSTISELASELEVDQSSASASIAKLAKGGFVKRRRARDERRINVSLTPKGRSVALRVGATGRPLLEEAVKAIGPEATKQLVANLSRLVDEMLAGRAYILASVNRDTAPS